MDFHSKSEDTHSGNPIWLFLLAARVLHTSSDLAFTKQNADSVATVCITHKKHQHKKKRVASKCKDDYNKQFALVQSAAE